MKSKCSKMYVPSKVIYLIVITNSVILINANIFGFMKSDPYLKSTTPQVIKHHGYPVEIHTVETKDGFLLKLHRIPYGRSGNLKKENRYPLLLCHEIIGSSYDWVLAGPNKSLGYRLPDEGYDVWLINFRGNVYSTGHVRLTQIQRAYWNFSFHETGIYDLPASIDYILKVTRREKLIVIGHSIGNAAFYILTSMLPTYNHKIEAQISMGPVTAIPNATTAFLLIFLFRNLIIVVTNTLFSGAFAPRNKLLNLLTDLLCNYSNVDFCNTFIVQPLVGFDPYQFDKNLAPPFFAHWPAGTSLKNVLHFGQITRDGSGFRQFDYGILGNMVNYGTPRPPAYNLNNMRVPIRVYYGATDNIASPIDSRSFYKQIPNPMGLIKINSSTFHHIDFIGAIHLNLLLNDNIIEVLNNITDITGGSSFISDTVRQAIHFRAKTP